MRNQQTFLILVWFCSPMVYSSSSGIVEKGTKNLTAPPSERKNRLTAESAATPNRMPCGNSAFPEPPLRCQDDDYV